jgi:hypothetical protein
MSKNKKNSRGPSRRGFLASLGLSAGALVFGGCASISKAMKGLELIANKAARRKGKIAVVTYPFYDPHSKLKDTEANFLGPDGRVSDKLRGDIKKVGDRYFTAVGQVGTPEDLVRMVDAVAKKHGPISFLYINAHGYPDKMRLSEDSCLKVSDFDTPKVMDIRKKLAPGCKVRFGSCLTGDQRVDKNLAQAASATWGVEVEAFTRSAYFSRLTDNLNMYGDVLPFPDADIDMNMVVYSKKNKQGYNSLWLQEPNKHAFFAKLDEQGKITELQMVVPEERIAKGRHYHLLADPNYPFDKRPIFAQGDLSPREKELLGKVRNLVNSFDRPFYLDLLKEENSSFHISDPAVTVTYRNGKAG